MLSTMLTQTQEQYDSTDVNALSKRIDNLAQELERVKSVILDAKEILTLEEAAVFLGISRSTLYKMTHTQTIPYYKPNNKLVYFERSELLAWLRKGHVASVDEIEAKANERLRQLAMK